MMYLLKLMWWHLFTSLYFALFQMLSVVGVNMKPWNLLTFLLKWAIYLILKKNFSFILLYYFTLQVLSKACKVPSVLLMSRLVMRKQISYFEYLCSITLSIGMFIFLFGNHQAQISSKLDRNEKLLNGFLVLSLYLVFDSFTSNWEEKFVRVYLFLLARQLQNWGWTRLLLEMGSRS